MLRWDAYRNARTVKYVHTNSEFYKQLKVDKNSLESEQKYC